MLLSLLLFELFTVELGFGFVLFLCEAECCGLLALLCCFFSILHGQHECTGSCGGL